MTILKVITDSPESKDIQLIRDAMSLELKRLEMALIKTDRIIDSLADKYHIQPEHFKKMAFSENFPNHETYTEFIGEIEIRDRLNDEIQRLKDIRYEYN